MKNTERRNILCPNPVDPADPYATQKNSIYRKISDLVRAEPECDSLDSVQVGEYLDKLSLSKFNFIVENACKNAKKQFIGSEDGGTESEVDVIFDEILREYKLNCLSEELKGLSDKNKINEKIRGYFSNDTLSDKQCEAINICCELKNSDQHLYFTNLSPQEAAQQMFKFILQPSLVNQGNSNVCGAAALLQVLISSAPEKYASGIKQLLETGKGEIGNLSLVCSNKEEVNINFALMDAMMNAANPVLGYNRNNFTFIETLTGSTRPKKIAQMMRDMGLANVQDCTFKMKSASKGGPISGPKGYIYSMLSSAYDFLARAHESDKEKSVKNSGENLEVLHSRFQAERSQGGEINTRSILFLNDSFVTEIDRIIAENPEISNYDWSTLSSNPVLNNPRLSDLIIKHYVNVKEFKIEGSNVVFSFETYGKSYNNIQVPMEVFLKNYHGNITGTINSQVPQKKVETERKFNKMIKKIEEKTILAFKTAVRGISEFKSHVVERKSDNRHFFTATFNLVSQMKKINKKERKEDKNFAPSKQGPKK